MGLKAQDSLSSFLQKNLPDKLQKITPGKTTEAELLTILDKPAVVKDGLYYYEISHSKYDTTIEIKNGVVDYLYYQFKKDKFLLNDLNKWIKPEDLETKINDLNDHSHASDLEVDKENLKLIFLDNSRYSLESVTFFQEKLK